MTSSATDGRIRDRLASWPSTAHGDVGQRVVRLQPGQHLAGVALERRKIPAHRNCLTSRLAVSVPAVRGAAERAAAVHSAPTRSASLARGSGPRHASEHRIAGTRASAAPPFAWGNSRQAPGTPPSCRATWAAAAAGAVVTVPS